MTDGDFWGFLEGLQFWHWLILGLALTLCLEDRGFAKTFRLEDLGALLALGLHLASHGIDEIARRRDVLDLDAGDLEAPGRGRVVDHVQQLGVDLVAL